MIMWFCRNRGRSVLIAVMMSWVLFRADDLGLAVGYYQALFGLGGAGSQMVLVGEYLTLELAVLLVAGFAGSMGCLPLIRGWLAGYLARKPLEVRQGLTGLRYGLRGTLIVAVLSLSIIRIYAGHHDPFIYFRF